MQIVLNAILFCLILALCGVCFAVGLVVGYKKKEAEKPKIEHKPLTYEQECEVEKQKRQEENFWNYNGSSQNPI